MAYGKDNSLNKRLMAFLRGAPGIAMTPDAIAERIGVPRANVAMRLSRMALYGEIDRVKANTHTGRGALYAYLAKSTADL